MIGGMPAFCLSLHAGYRCRHAGVCCRTWSVPVEPQVMQVVSARGLRRAGTAGPLFIPDAGGSGWRTARDAAGRCVFFDEARGRLCVIHAAAGPGALPSACRHFPRVVLRDPRGTFVSLSHVCPTAASLLPDAGSLEVVEAPPSLALDEPVEGLDAREALPPLLRPGLLTDVEGYDAWERAALAILGRDDVTWVQALEWIDAATADVRRWRPGGISLAARVEAAFRSAGPSAARSGLAGQARAIERIRAIGGRGIAADFAPVPDFESRWADLVSPAFATLDRTMKNYLAARLFGNWIAWQGQGLRSVVEWLRTCAAVVRYHAVRRRLEKDAASAPDDPLEPFRRTDLLLLHALDTQAFARAAAGVEAADHGEAVSDRV